MTTTPPVEFSRRRLDNGLRVILHSDRRMPLVHVTVHYRVGSSYETPRNSGFAHLFEHLMFQGSANVPKNEHGRLVDAAGGRWNATTSKDRTNYFQTLPSNHLSLALWLEADRMRSLRITEENFENQRQTVLEEKKQSYDNRPYGKAFLRFDEIAYDNWAYGHPVIGSEEDLVAAKLGDVEAFHRKHYRPGNATLVVAGDIEPESAFEEIAMRFESIPNGSPPPPPDLTEPARDAPRREDVADRLAVLPGLLVGYPMPELGTPDSYALSLLGLALTAGESSILRRLMVYEKNWVTGISSGPNGYRGPQMFTVWTQVQAGVDSEDALKTVIERLEGLAAEPLAEEDLEKSRHQALFRLMEGRKTISGIGENLARMDVFFDDPERINRESERYLRVGAGDIQEAARRVFRPSNRHVLRILPDGAN